MALLLDVAELQLLDYPEGGHYRRHLDSGTRAVNASSRARSACLLYLTPEGWDVEVDGGQLRAYHQEAEEEGEEMVEVAPEAGTLVLFASSKVPHEVVATRRRRLAVAGWLCEQCAPIVTSKRRPSSDIEQSNLGSQLPAAPERSLVFGLSDILARSPRRRWSRPSGTPQPLHALVLPCDASFA